ncbi:MAG: Ig-like domain-containing protein [Cytophagaceae bacterium]|jgi:hypothetical protein|nr:Ig-like domain-containing protein [Cytophagaceae bacterium]
MKKLVQGILVSGVLSASVLAQTFPFGAGRIAMSFDGNLHDDDDIIALPVSLGIAKAAGHQSKVVHVEYNNNTCGNANTVDNDGGDYADKPEFEGRDAAHMVASAQGMIDRYGYSPSVMFDHIANPAGCESHLRAEINRSTSANPLFIIAAGPMETIWRAINGSSSSAHPHVYIISHGRWNENYYRADCSPHTWTSIGNNFPAIKRVAIPDQNYRLNRALSTNEWDWMRTSSDANLRWMYTRNPFVSKFDPSDAGMVYYLISNGGNIVNGNMSGGNNSPSITDIRNVLTNPVVIGQNQNPQVSFLNPAAGSNFPAPATLIVRASASDADGSIVSVELFMNGVSVRKELVSPYEWNHINQDPVLSNLSSGTYQFTAVATDNKGATASTNLTITIGSLPTGNPTVSFAQPLNAATTGKNIVVQVNASDADGTISNVKLFLDGNLIRQENTAPYVWNSTNGGSLDPVLANLSAGSHQLKALATDNAGKTSEATITIQVNASARSASYLDQSIVEWSAFPNPFQDRFIVTTANSRVIAAQLKDVNGMVVPARILLSEDQVEVLAEALLAGIYWLELNTENGPIVSSVIKQ